MILTRATSEFDVTGDGRTLEGIAFHWDLASLVVDDDHPAPYLEEFDPKAADQTLRMRAIRPLFVMHEHVKGSAGETTFDRSAEGLVFRARATDSTFARMTLDRVNAGELPEVSVAFRPIRHAKRPTPKGIVTRRLEIAIAELSLAEPGTGLHQGARVLAVRSAPAGASDTPRLDALRRRRALMAP